MRFHCQNQIIHNYYRPQDCLRFRPKPSSQVSQELKQIRDKQNQETAAANISPLAFTEEFRHERHSAPWCIHAIDPGFVFISTPNPQMAMPLNSSCRCRRSFYKQIYLTVVMTSFSGFTELAIHGNDFNAMRILQRDVSLKAGQELSSKSTGLQMMQRKRERGII